MKQEPQSGPSDSKSQPDDTSGPDAQPALQELKPQHKAADIAEVASNPEKAPEVIPEPPEQPADGIIWRLSPGDLEVMRNTKVSLSMSWKGPPKGKVTCEWDPGDRTGIIEGCNVDHIFEGGLNDRTVKLTVFLDGETVYSDSRQLPVEKLPVVEMNDRTYKLPEPPGQGGTRMVLFSLSAAPNQKEAAQLARVAATTKPELLVLLLNSPMTKEQVSALLGLLGENQPWVVLPLYCDRGEMTIDEVRSLPWPDVLLHSTDADAPFKYSFLLNGVSFTVPDTRNRSGDLDMEKWLLSELAQAKVASHRVLLSCSALENFTEYDMGILTPNFRFYEKIMRGDPSLFVTGTQPVHYYGRYGQIPTLAPGVVVGSPGALLGTTKPQRRLVSVIDFKPALPPLVMAVAPDAPDTVLNLRMLPAEVGSYQRITQKSLTELSPAPPRPPEPESPQSASEPIEPVVIEQPSGPAVIPPVQPVGIYAPPSEP